MKDTTEEVHYENYRAQHIQQQSINNNNLSPTQAKADAVISKNGHKVEQLLNEKDEEVCIYVVVIATNFISLKIGRNDIIQR